MVLLLVSLDQMTGVAPPRRIVLSLYNSDGRSAPIWEKPRLEDLEDFARSHLRGHFPPGHDVLLPLYFSMP